MATSKKEPKKKIGTAKPIKGLAEFIATQNGYDHQISRLFDNVDYASKQRRIQEDVYYACSIELLKARIENAKLLEIQKQTQVLGHIHEALLKIWGASNGPR